MMNKTKTKPIVSQVLNDSNKTSGEFIIKVMQGRNLPFINTGDVYVEITATTYERFLNLGIDDESERI